MQFFNLELFLSRGILLAEEKRFSEAVQSYENAIHFRPRLAGKDNNFIIKAFSDQSHLCVTFSSSCVVWDVKNLSLTAAIHFNWDNHWAVYSPLYFTYRDMFNNH